MSVTEPEADEWAALWAGELAQKERDEVQAIATRVSRRARLSEHGDLFIAVLIATGVLLALVVRPTPVTLAVGLVAALALLVPSWGRHKERRRLAAMLAIADRRDLVEKHARGIKLDLQQSTAGLIGTPFVILLFAMLAESVWAGGTLSGFGDMLAKALLDLPTGPAILAAMLALLAQQVRRIVRLRRELRRLEQVSGEYRRESVLDEHSTGALYSR